MCSSSHHQRSSTLIVVGCMCLSVLPEAAAARAGLFTGSLTQVMQSQLAISINILKSVGVRRLWLWLTTLGTSKLPETCWQMQKVLTCQSQHCFSMQPRGVSLTVIISTPKLKHAEFSFDGCKVESLKCKLSVLSLYIGLQRVSSHFKLKTTVDSAP